MPATAHTTALWRLCMSRASRPTHSGLSAGTPLLTGLDGSSATAPPERLRAAIEVVKPTAAKPEMPASGPTAPPNAMGSRKRTRERPQLLTE